MSDFKTFRKEMELESGSRGHTYEDLDPKLRDGIIHFFNDDREFFNQHLGMKLVDVKKGYSRIELETKANLCQPANVMHGGASFGVADSAVAMALVAMYGQGKLLLTIEMKINYLEAIPKGSMVTAEAYVLRASRSSAYAEVDIWAAGKLAGRANTTYMIRDR